MKIKFLLISFITSLFFYSCGKDDSTDEIIDPELSIESYSFSSDGEEISIYSKKELRVYIAYDPSIDKMNDNAQFPDIKVGTPGVVSIDGDWYSVAVEYPYTVKMKIMANTTGRVRYIPVIIYAINAFPDVSYIQEK
ncbi:MAG: hypothetical protein QM660_05740 [Dysgonomonas sp.]